MMQMKKATAISAGLHAAVLVWATLSFSGKALDATPTESLPVDLISEKDFSQVTKGVKKAPKPVEKPKPLVEKKAAEIKPVEDIKPKVSEKPEIKPTADKLPEPPPAPEKKPEQKQAKAADAKPPQPMGEQKPDPIAETLKKDDTPKLSKVAERLPPRRPPQPKQKDFRELAEAALIDQREPRRMAAAGDVLNHDATLGRVDATASRLSQSEIDAFKRRVTDCWSPPVGLDSAQEMEVVFRVLFNRDGSIKRGPDIISGKATASGPVFAESARRAILQCQPYTMLRPEHYDNWKDMELAFTPSDMFR